LTLLKAELAAKLPQELRDLVYEYVFAHDKPYTLSHCHMPQLSEYQRYFLSASSGHPEICTEAVKALYRSGWWEVSETPSLVILILPASDPFRCCVPPHKFIKNLCLRLSIGSSWNDESTMGSEASALTRGILVRFQALNSF